MNTSASRTGPSLPPLRGGPARALLPLLALLASACAHAGRVEQGVFYEKRGKFEVPAPPAPWEVVWVEDAQFTATNRASGASMAVNRTCRRLRAGDLDVISKGLFIGLERKERRAGEFRTLPAGEAYYTELDGAWEGARARIASYVLLDGGCVVDMALVAAPDRFDAALPDFEAMARGLRLR